MRDFFAVVARVASLARHVPVCSCACWVEIHPRALVLLSNVWGRCSGCHPRQYMTLESGQRGAL